MLRTYDFRFTVYAIENADLASSFNHLLKNELYDEALELAKTHDVDPAVDFYVT
jgi:hypothetical protein